jgi:PmbA protein
VSHVENHSLEKQAELRALAERVTELAIDDGACAAEVIVGAGQSLSVKVRRGQKELLHESESHGLGLRVFVNHRSAVCHTSDLSESALRRFVHETVELSALSEPDELNELPHRDELVQPGQKLPQLALWDERTAQLSAPELFDLARRCEAATLAHSQKITNTDGASADRNAGYMALALADKSGLAFSGSSRGTYCSFSVEALCDDDSGKKRNASYWSANRFFARLDSPESVGAEAARRALSKLGAQKLATAELPVVFDPDASRALLRTLSSVVSGGSIYRKSSYLCGRENTEVASPLITVVDDPLLPNGPGSRVFDGEGLLARRNVIVEKGILRGYLLDNYSARKLGRKSNGCAGRSVGGSPHVTTSNLILCAGSTAPDQLLCGIERGLLVTDMMGFGFNAVTGDFSRGASGFLIEKGQITVPVSEVTISANFDELLKRIDAVGSDIDERSSTMSPSLRVTRMTVAGH